jgi:HEPN domain-containing protein
MAYTMSDSLELDKSKAQNLSLTRIKEAEILLKENCFAGAYYLAGYSVELALKAVICKKFKRETIPDKNFVQSLYTHKLDDLMTKSELKFKFDEDKKANSQLDTYWTVVTKWNENSRYDLKSEQDATSIINAINDPQNGILSWIKQHW